MQRLAKKSVQREQPVGPFKRALVISGGGVKGSFAVGLLKAMAEADPNFYKRYDIFAGTSTGSLIAPLASLGQFDLLTKLYTDPTVLERYYRSNGTIPDVLRRGSALYNTDGLKQKVREVIEPIYDVLDTAGRVMLFASVSITTGDLIYFTNKDLSRYQPADDQFRYQKVDNVEEMVNAIMASANQPVVAELVQMRNARTHRVEQFADGGVRDYLPIKAAINLGATEIDVIQCSPFFFDERHSYQGILPILFRTLALITDQIGQSNIDYAKRLLDQDTSHIRRIRIFRAPHAGYGTDNGAEFPFLSNALNFDAEKMRTMWEEGMQVHHKIERGEIKSPADEYIEYTPEKVQDKGEILK